jgi:P-type conjugative transfer protein TrbJ
MKNLLLAMVVLRVATLPAYAIIPTIDSANLVQNTTIALKQVASYAQQVSQYQLQIQQYENQLRNTAAPVAQVWQSAQSAMRGVMGTVSIFQNPSGLQSYLNQFQDYNYWLSAPSSNYNAYQATGSVAQKQANDAMVNGIVAQQAQIQRDAASLQQLQSQASTADGQMKALSAANQLAALQQEQLLQIRALLLQEQQSLAARSQTDANDAAMRKAATEKFFNVPQIEINHTGW